MTQDTYHYIQLHRLSMRLYLRRHTSLAIGNSPGFKQDTIFDERSQPQYIMGLIIISGCKSDIVSSQQIEALINLENGRHFAEYISKYFSVYTYWFRLCFYFRMNKWRESIGSSNRYASTYDTPLPWHLLVWFWNWYRVWPCVTLHNLGYNFICLHRIRLISSNFVISTMPPFLNIEVAP